MTDIKMFKLIASTNLPESLYQQLEPHLESLLDDISSHEQIDEYFSYDNQKQLNQLKFEFRESVSSMWPAFARERWPEVDNYFDLEKAKQADYFSFLEFYSSKISK